MSTGAKDLSEELHKIGKITPETKVVSLRPLKDIAPTLVEPLKSLFLNQPDEISIEELRIKAIEWWKLARLVYKA